jgi:hypothetical protein
LEHALSDGLGHGGYFLLGTLAFLGMGYMLYRIGMRKEEEI